MVPLGCPFSADESEILRMLLEIHLRRQEIVIGLERGDRGREVQVYEWGSPDREPARETSQGSREVW